MTERPFRFTFFLLMCLLIPLTATAQTVNIPDANLRAAIESALGKTPGATITVSDMSGLPRLVAPNASISDLTGLEHATNLTVLNLGGEVLEERRINSNSITDLSSLRRLINLTELFLDGNSITDITSLGGLTNLIALDLSGNTISNITSLGGLTNLIGLRVGNNSITDITSLGRLTNLVGLSLGDNTVSNITSLGRLTNVVGLNLEGNSIADISPLVTNTGLGSGDFVDVKGNPLSSISINTHIPVLQEKGVEVMFDHRTPQKIRIVSGDNQQGLSGAVLTNPFIVEVRDQYDKPFQEVQVKFSVTGGGGTLSATTTATDNNGRAESTLTLGPNPGTNTVTVSVTGIQEKQTFNAEGFRIPETLDIVSGNDQEGLPGAALENPFVVEVRDRFDNPFSGAQVTFAVASGGGRLSVSTATTDSDGRAESTLTLGPNPGANTVTVSVTGIQAQQTFNAEGIRIPLAFWIISGDTQQGLPSEALAKPFVVEVRDKSGEPLPGVQVIFSVSSGGGTPSVTSATTNNNGRAESTFTLGLNPGRNTVTVSVAGIEEQQTFTAEGIRIPETLDMVSGNDQEGLPGAALENPFVVEVRDQAEKPLPEVEVSFSVSSGGGTLSETSVRTNSNGRAESRLTLGPNPGTNTVTVSVAGIQAQQTFNAEGIRIPLAFWIISGDTQQGLPGEALAKPFVVEVRDQSGEPLPGAQVIFAVSSGGGTLSVTSTTTDSDSRAESILTLGPNPEPNSVTVSVTGIQEEQTVTAIAEPPPIPQDVNRDDAVNILDLVFVASALGDEGQGLVADVNEDGIVNILDLVSVAGALGDVAAAPSLHPQALAMLTATDVGQWLVQAGELGLTDTTSQRGVLFLKQLLAALTPKETALLPNYPNPFNPESWIPYRLADDANVTLTIYDASGIMVRRLDLGHQSAGFYESRSEAIYWDGRNDFGEGVASGVYFYTITAGDYSATRKMLIMK